MYEVCTLLKRHPNNNQTPHQLNMRKISITLISFSYILRLYLEFQMLFVHISAWSSSTAAVIPQQRQGVATPLEQAVISRRRKMTFSF
jgi:hypothetical protein